MTAAEIIWFAGDETSQRQIEKALAAGLDGMRRLHGSAHRTVYQIARPALQTSPTDPVGSVALKIHHAGTGLRRLRESLKRRIARSPAQREWRALVALHEKGVPVAHPRAWGRLPNGDEIVASDFLEGAPLADRFRRALPQDRGELALAMARTLQTFHATGYRHGDLHLGNLWIRSDAQGDIVYLLDLESARPCRRLRERLVDLAQLEFSLTRAGWESDRLTDLRARLGPDKDLEAVSRHFLRDHLRGRARRVLRIGRNWSAAKVGACKGLREASLDARTLTALIESSEANPVAKARRGGRVRITEESANGRRFVVKRVAASRLRRALADRLRGSSAARAFHAGQRLALLSNHSARPLALLEERRFGFPIQSWLVLERVGQDDLDHFDPGDPSVERRVAMALGAWLADMHAWGLSHRDLKGGNIRLTVSADSIRFWLIDLEDLIGPIELSEAHRLRALSQLNASLSDAAFSLEARRSALDAYLARAPFAEMDSRTIAGEIARRSLARMHHWQGLGCDLARPRTRPKPD